MSIPTNNILAKMRDGVRARGCALTFPSNNLAELIGLAGLDFLYLDGEHGSFSPTRSKTCAAWRSCMDLPPSQGLRTSGHQRYSPTWTAV